MKFVCRQRKHINIITLDVDIDMACGLHSVRVEKHAALAAKRTDFFDRLDGAGFVVGIHDRNKAGRVGEGSSDLCGGYDTVLLRTQQRNREALLLQHLERVQDSVMLHRCRDDVALALLPADSCGADKRLIICLAAAGGEEKLLWRTVQKLCQLLARAEQRCGAALA